MNPIFNSNTIAGGLSNSQIGSTAIPILDTGLAPIRKISTPALPEKLRTGKVEVPLTTSTSSSVADPVDFQTGDNVFATSEATVQHIVVRGHIAQGEANLGLGYPHLAGNMARTFATSVLQGATAKFTVGAYGAADVTGAAASFSIANLKTLIAACPGTPRVCLISNAALQSISASLHLGPDGLWHYPGIDGGIYECSPVGDGYVYVASPEALTSIIARPAAMDSYPRADITVTPLVLPVLGITIYHTAWVDLTTRANWFALESLVGFGVGNVGGLAFAAAS